MNYGTLRYIKEDADNVYKELLKIFHYMLNYRLNVQNRTKSSRSFFLSVIFFFFLHLTHDLHPAKDN